MSDWIHIEPLPQLLTPNQKRIRELLDAGKSVWQIALSIHMSWDAVRDEIYEIRKKESIMGKKPKFNRAERAELLRLHNEERYSVGKLATKYGCSQTAVKTALNAAKIEAEDEPKKTQINAEFDAAVDDMIAESKAADVDKQSAIAEPELDDCENGIANTPLPVPEQLENVQGSTQDKLPPVVCRAVIGHLNDLEMEIESREERIAELNIEIEEFRRDIAALKEWKEKHFAAGQ